jgi:hypothetical protein
MKTDRVEPDPQSEVIKRLLEMSRIIRRRGTPDEAEAVLPYERQLEADLKARELELRKQKDLIEVAA